MKILVLGNNGQLAKAFRNFLPPLGEALFWGSGEADLLRLDLLKKKVLDFNPQLIINAAAYTNVDLAETETEKAQAINCAAPELLAQLAHKMDALLVHYSTDYVFDGQKKEPYDEKDEPRPLNIYGATKLAGDQALLHSKSRHLIFRTSWLYAQTGRNFPSTILKVLQDQENCEVTDSQKGAPTACEFLAAATILAVNIFAREKNRKMAGLYHLSSKGETTWFEYARYLAHKAQAFGAHLKCPPQNIIAGDGQNSKRPAQRPANSRLNCQKFETTFQLTSPHWSHYLDLFIPLWLTNKRTA